MPVRAFACTVVPGLRLFADHDGERLKIALYTCRDDLAPLQTQAIVALWQSFDPTEIAAVYVWCNGIAAAIIVGHSEWKIPVDEAEACAGALALPYQPSPEG